MRVKTKTWVMLSQDILYATVVTTKSIGYSMHLILCSLKSIDFGYLFNSSAFLTNENHFTVYPQSTCLA